MSQLKGGGRGRVDVQPAVSAAVQSQHIWLICVFEIAREFSLRSSLEKELLIT